MSPTNTTCGFAAPDRSMLSRSDFVQEQWRSSVEWRAVVRMADRLGEHLETPEMSTLLEAANQPGTSSALVQAAFLGEATELGFVDESNASSDIAHLDRTLLDSAVTSYGAYLDLWRLYSEKEWQRDVARAAAISAVRYASCQAISEEGGGWNLVIDQKSLSAFQDAWREHATEDDQVEIDELVNVEVKGNAIVIFPANSNPRQGWRASRRLLLGFVRMLR